MKLLIVVLVLALAGTACSSEGEGDPGGLDFAACGLPSPEPGVKSSLLPREMVPEGGEVTIAVRERGGYRASISVPMGVQGAFERYERVMSRAGWDEIAVDNEGFEAEIYLKRKEDLAGIQIRRSVCDDASNVFVNVIAARRGGEAPVLPVPSGARSPSPVP